MPAEAVCGPSILPIAMVVVTNKAPFAIPFKRPNRMRIAKLDLTEIANMVMVLRAMIKRNMLVESSLSQAIPEPRRPTAIQAL